MATLHVRNVPDPLYESLRECATANGRSIGAEVIVLIERRVLDDISQKPRILRRGSRRRRPSTPFQHFDPVARNLIVAAREEAAALGAAGIGTEHLLLAVLQGSPGALTPLLERHGLDHARARAAVEGAADPAAAASTPEAIPFTPDAKQAMELALRDSLGLGADSIDQDHLLLGISRVHESHGARILADAGLHWPVLHGELLRETEPPVVVRPRQAPSTCFRVVALEGPVAEWERLLNAHAAEGHELVEIVEKRAIFRVRLQ